MADESTIHWFQVGIGAVRGGTMGALVTAIVTNWRARIQPVHVIHSTTAIINSSAVRPELAAKVTVGSGTSAREYESLWLLEVSLSNSGNKDLDSFSFGMTLDTQDPCIGMGWEGADRHHEVRVANPPSPSVPRQELDVTLSPFNRKDVYQFRLYIAPQSPASVPRPPRFGSKASVRFVDRGTVSEALSHVLARTSLELALPLSRISFRQ